MMEILLSIVCIATVAISFMLLHMKKTVEELKEQNRSLTKLLEQKATEILKSNVAVVEKREKPVMVKKTMTEQQKRAISEKAKIRWAQKKAQSQKPAPIFQELAAT